MTSSKANALFLLFFIWMCIFPCSVRAEEKGEQKTHLGIGLGAGGSTSEYRQTGVAIWPVPLVSYEGERFYVRGLTGGVHFLKNRHHELSLNVSYLPQHFYAGDSGSHAMRQLDDRYPTMMAGASYSLRTDWGTARLSVSADALGTSNGVVMDGAYFCPVNIQMLRITPGVGLTWTNSNHNDYYYGISEKESRKSGYKKYTAGDGFSPYAGLNIKIAVTDHFDFWLNGKTMLLSSEMADSPMVDRGVKFSFGAGIAKS
jgi:outer membrane protein